MISKYVLKLTSDIMSGTEGQDRCKDRLPYSLQVQTQWSLGVVADIQWHGLHSSVAFSVHIQSL